MNGFSFVRRFGHNRGAEPKHKPLSRKIYRTAQRMMKARSWPPQTRAGAKAA
jgi:hypothetical protein